MTHEDKQALVKEQQTSGLTQAEFCTAKSIKLASFRQWKYHRAKLQGNPPQFVQLVPASPIASRITVIAGRFRVDVPEDFERTHLRAVLESLPC